MRKMILAAALLSLVAVSCEMQVNLMLDIQEDASGTVAVEIAVDEEMLALLSQEGDPTEQIFEGIDDTGLDDVTFSERTEGEFTYYTISAPFADVSEITDFLEQGDATPLTGTFDITATEDRITLNAVSENTDAAFSDGGFEGLEGFEVGALETFFSANVRARLPGDVTSNADRILDDGTLEWDLPLSGERVVIEAEADLTGGGGFPWWIVAVVAVVAVVGIALVLRNRSGDSAIGSVEEPEEPAVVTPGAEAPPEPAPPAE